MATESPIRITEASEKWPSRNDAASFGQSFANMNVEDLGLLFKGKFEGDLRNVVPNRCESAPPYFSYDPSYTSMNSRISTPQNSWENETLARSIGSRGGDRNVKSHDDLGKKPSQLNLPTHREEPEDEGFPQGIVGDQDPRKCLVGLTQVIDQPSANNLSFFEEAVDNDADLRQVSSSDPQSASVSASSSANSTGGTFVRPSLYGGQLPAVDVPLGLNLSSSDVTDSNVACVEARMKAVDKYATSDSETSSLKNQQQGTQSNIKHQQLIQQQSFALQAQGSETEMTPRGMKASSGMPQFFHGASTFSAKDGQPILHSSGYTPPLYATAAALMTSPAPFYPNLQLPGYFHPQFVGGGYYAVNATVPLHYLAGYPPYGAVPQALTPPTSGVASGGNTFHAVDPHLNRLYGQLGFPLQPSFTDPVHLQYFQQPFRDAFSFPGHLNYPAPRDGAAGNAITTLDLRKGADAVTQVADQKARFSGSVGQSVYNHPRRGSITSQYYLGSPLMQYPALPVASPIFPGTSMAGTSSGGGRNDMRFSSVAGRHMGSYSSWQGQSLDNSNSCSLLQELKSGKGHLFELADIAGHIVEFSADQHGSRFIQQKLESCGSEEKEAVFKEILPHAPKLMTDVFGNYVIQKLFEYGTTEQQKNLADQLEGQVLPLSLQMYGCRVIQKALEVIQLEQKLRLVHELDGQIMRCVQDQNGNHVIQKCIESIPTDKIQFIISSFRGQVAQLSRHPYGCRVIQRILEHCTNQLQSQFIVDEILESICALAQDQYGNYVAQQIRVWDNKAWNCRVDCSLPAIKPGTALFSSCHCLLGIDLHM